MASASLSDLVRVHKALGNPTRLRILAMLRTGELCACQVAAVLRLAPSTVSAHVAELRRAQLIHERREGRWVHYRLSESPDVEEVAEEVWRRVRRDEQVRHDAAVVKQLRRVPLHELCSVDRDLDRLAISRST